MVYRVVNAPHVSRVYGDLKFKFRALRIWQSLANTNGTGAGLLYRF